MNLYFLRHAIAVEAGSPAYADDSQRTLTDKGILKMKQIAAGLQHIDVNFDLILSSPYVRARETAKILAKAHLSSNPVILTQALLPETPANQIIAEINEFYSSYKSIVLVGHQPSLNTLISILISGDPTLNITLKKGGLCRLQVEQLRYERCATLDWLLYPFQLADLSEIN